MVQLLLEFSSTSLYYSLSELCSVETTWRSLVSTTKGIYKHDNEYDRYHLPPPPTHIQVKSVLHNEIACKGNDSTITVNPTIYIHHFDY